MNSSCSCGSYLDLKQIVLYLISGNLNFYLTFSYGATQNTTMRFLRFVIVAISYRFIFHFYMYFTFPYYSLTQKLAF
jgi:hypothetical protein